MSSYEINERLAAVSAKKVIYKKPNGLHWEIKSLDSCASAISGFS